MRLLILCVTGYAIIVLYMFLIQRHLIYVPDTASPALSSSMQEVRFQTEDALSLSAWYRAPADQELPVIVFFHGNVGHRGDRLDKVTGFMEAGFGVLLVDYRGYGGNPGKPSEQGLYRDGQAALKWVQEKSPSGIILYGESLGTGVAVHLAAFVPEEFCALILEAPYTSLTELSAHYHPYLPVKLLLKDKFDSYSKIQNIKIPLLILHGVQDQTIPVSYGKKLYQAASMPKKLHLIKEAGHNDLYDYGAEKVILDFLKDCKKQK